MIKWLGLALAGIGVASGLTQLQSTAGWDPLSGGRMATLWIATFVWVAVLRLGHIRRGPAEVMAKHDDLMREGAREAPEPETAEQRTKRVGWGAAGGGLLGGAAVAAKLGGLSKLFIWLFAFHAFNLWRLGSWIGLAVALVAIATFVFVRSRRPT